VRRSVREYKPDPVSREMIEQILNAASTAPMGIPPSEVHVPVFATRESGPRVGPEQRQDAPCSTSNEVVSLV
jgi:nitroreductase